MTIASPLAVSADEWWGDDPYWNEQRASTEASPAARRGDTDGFGGSDQGVAYAAQGTTIRDVSVIDEAPKRLSGVEIVEYQNAERLRLDRAGFPQFTGGGE
jgi:hypothetical protein